MTVAYATAAELRAQMGKVSATDDAVLNLILLSATDALERACSRVFLKPTTATAREYYGSGMSYQAIDECTSVTKVEVKEAADLPYVTWSLTADVVPFCGDPRWPDFNSIPRTALMVAAGGDYAIFNSSRHGGHDGFTPLEQDTRRADPMVRVTAYWAYSVAVPPTAKQAVLAQATRWYKRAQGGWSNVLVTGEQGMEMYAKPGFAALDTDIYAMVVLARLVKPMVG
jgi:hypothetical protein